MSVPSKKSFFSSVRAKVLIVLSLVLLVQIVYVIFYLRVSQEQRIEVEAKQRLNYTLSRLQGTLEYLFRSNDLIQVQEEIAALGTDYGINSAFLLNSKDMVIASIRYKHVGNSLKTATQDWHQVDQEKLISYLNSSVSGNVWLSEAGKSVIGVFPISTTKSQPDLLSPSAQSGDLILQYNLVQTKNEAVALIFQQLVYQVLLVIAAAIFIHFQVTRRVHKLREATEDISYIGQTSLMDISGHDEIADLSVSLNTMSKRIHSGQQKIRRHSDQMEAILNASAEGIAGFNADGICIFANNAAYKILQVDEQVDLAGEAINIFFNAPDEKDGAAYFDAILENCSSGSHYNQCIEIGENRKIDLEMNCYPLQDADGRVGLVVTFLDVTERKMIANDMITKNYAVDTSINGIMFADLDGVIKYVNQSFLDLWGLDEPANVINQDAYQYFGMQKLHNAVLSAVRNAGHWRGDVVAHRSDGSHHHMQLLVSLIRDEQDIPLFLMSSFMDITEMKNTQAALQRSEETYAKAEAIAHIGSWDWDILDGELHWTDEIYRIFGQEPRSFGATYDAFLETIHPDDRQRITDAVSASIEDPNIEYNIEHRIIRSKTNEERVVQERGQVYRDDDGKPIRMIGTVYDITEQKQNQRALYEERNFVSGILDSAGALVVVLDRQGRIEKFNRACEQTTGFRSSELMGTYIWDHLIVDEQKDAVKSVFRNLKAGGQANEYENYWLTKNGDRRQIGWFNSVLKSPEGEVEHLIAVGMDITERNKAEQELARHREHLEEMVLERTQELDQAQSQLLRKERLAALGQLTATVSHELRNPLGAMTPSLYIIKRKLPIDSQQLSDAVQRLERNIHRCDHIIDELLDFTRITGLNRKEVLLEKWLGSVLLDVNMPDDVTVERDFQCGDMIVDIDVDRLRRAVINVVENAYQATLENSDKEKQRIKITVHQDADRLLIDVQDNGVGMDQEVKERLFEPLFSTKGFGVGLGMPTVKQIMKQHLGGIEVQSESGQGTTITLWLPEKCIVEDDITLDERAG